VRWLRWGKIGGVGRMEAEGGEVEDELITGGLKERTQVRVHLRDRGGSNTNKESQ